MLSKLKDYVSNKYNLKCELNIDLKIYSPNVEDEYILVTTLEDEIIIKFSDVELSSDKKKIYKDISYVLDHLRYVYFLSVNEDLLSTLIYYAKDDRTLTDEIEDFIWHNHEEMHIDHVFVLSFANDYSYETYVSGSFIDTYWQIYDEAHYNVVDESFKRFKYKSKDYAITHKSLLDNVIPSKYNIEFLRKFFLEHGYAFLLDYVDMDTKNVYELIDIDLDSCKNICGDDFAIISADYKSLLVYSSGMLYVRGRISDMYPSIEKIIQVDNEPSKFILSLKTARILYEGKMYEASGDKMTDAINKLDDMLGGKILSCYSCKYGNYITNDREIFCLKGFKPKDFADVLYFVDETKLIPYDPCNLCEDYEILEKGYYTHSPKKEAK